jgi:hypothetical protein
MSKVESRSSGLGQVKIEQKKPLTRSGFLPFRCLPAISHEHQPKVMTLKNDSQEKMIRATIKVRGKLSKLNMDFI